MLQIKTDEEKELHFDVVIEGIEKSNLVFKFRLHIDDVEYGFPGTLIGEKVRVLIPPLQDVVNVTNGMYKGKLEVMGEEKYYIMPWQDDVEIKTEPKVLAAVTEQAQLPTSENIKVRAFLSTPTLVEKKVEKPKKTAKENPGLRKLMK
jgi:hypothetical protein